MSASPPKLNLVRFLVLDEADRLLNVGFAKDLGRITEPMSSTRRQTLLFSATMSTNVTKLRDLASAQNRAAFEYHAASAESTVDNLREEYLLAPQQVKQSYLAYILRRMGPVQEPSRNKLITRWVSVCLFVGI
jgi:ATP-dependent RNA helicase DDX49/DBP8